MTDAPALLPDRLPVVAGVELAATHVPGSDPCFDWYDVIALPGGAVGIAIADVPGRGEHAAALANRLRSRLHERVDAGDAPGEALRRVNALVTDVGTQMSTLMFLRYTPATGELRGANAGHLPALIRHAGVVERWDAARTLPLGVADDRPFPEDARQLGPGDAVLAFTDGLVERRDPELEDALQRLERAVPVFGSADAVRTAVLDAMFGPRVQDDDVAVVARVVSPGG